MDEWQIVALVLCGLPLWWSAILMFVARVGPWRQLAERYPEEQWITGRKYRWTSLHSGLTNYSYCILAEAGDDRLRLVPIFPFRWHHPPIVLPREAIHDLRFERRLGIRCVRFRVDAVELTLAGGVIHDRFFNEETIAR